MKNDIEDLHSGEIYRKSKLNFKKLPFVYVIIIILLVITITSLVFKFRGKPSTDILSLRAITDTLKSKGLSIKRDYTAYTPIFQSEGSKPYIYTIDKTKDKLLIYIFKSIGSRMDAVNAEINIEQSNTTGRISFNAKNAYITYLAYETTKDKIDMKQTIKIYNLISDITFKYLNDGKELVFKGESTSWEGTIALKYYIHWWKDENGVLRNENYNKATPIIKYKLSNSSGVGLVTIEYITPGVGGGKVTGATLKGDNTIDFVPSGGIDGTIKEEDTYNFKISWNDKEEKLILKTN